MCVYISYNSLSKIIDLVVDSDSSLDSNEQDFFKEMLYDLATHERLSIDSEHTSDIIGAFKFFRQNCSLIHRDGDEQLAWEMMEQSANTFVVNDGEVVYRHRIWINRETGILLMMERPANNLFKFLPAEDLMAVLEERHNAKLAEGED